MSTQQDIYAAGSESRPPMLNKDNYVPWSSRLLRYAKSIPNGKLIHNSILNGPYVRRMIPEPGDATHEVNMTETFHVQTDDEFSEKELKQIEADDQAIQTILLGLPKDIYATVDSCETAQEIWLRVQQMMKGSDIGIHEKKAKLFNEWARFTSNEGESIESYYHRFLKLMNDLKRKKHFPEKIASNLKFLNNLQPEWSRHVTIVHQTKDLHTADYTQLYDFLNISPRQSSFNPNYLQKPMPNPEDITDPTTAMNIALALMAKAFKLNYSTPTNNNQRILSNPCNRQIAQPGMNMGQDRQMQMVRGYGENQFRQYARQNAGNLNKYNAVQNVGNQVAQNLKVQNVGNQNGPIGVPGNGNQNGNGNLLVARAEGNLAGHNGNQIRCYNCRGVEEYDLMATVADLDEIEEVNANCILMANLQQASTSGTQTDNAPVYDSDGSAEVHENCVDNEIFNIFTLEEQYTELLEPIPEPQQVPQNDNNVISEVTSVEQETLQLAQESREKMKQMNKEIKLANYAKINHHSGVFVPQTTLSSEELYFSNNSKTTNVSKSISIPNEDLSNDTTPSVARKFLNEVKSTIVTLQRVVKHRMTIETHNWESSAHQELHKIIREEIFPIVNQVDARLQKFKIQFLKEAAKFVGDFKSLANEADASLVKHKALELEIERLLKAVVSQDIISVVQSESVVDTSVLKLSLNVRKNALKTISLKRRMNMLNFGMIDTLNPLSQKLQSKNVELEFQVLNYARENAHLKATYKNLFDSISVLRTQTKNVIASLKNELQSTIYKNAKLRTQLFKKVSDQKDNTCDTSANTKFAKQPIVENLPNVDETHALSKPVTSNSVSTPQESKGVNNDKVIAPGMFRINSFKTFREEKHVPITVRASDRTKLITVSQSSVITKKHVNSDVNGLSSTGVDNTKTRRPHPRSDTKNDRVPSASKSSRSQNKEAEVEEHHRNLLLSKKNKHMSSVCNNIKLDSQDVISKVFYAMCKQCFIYINHDVCLHNYVNGKKSRGKKHKANVSMNEKQQKHQPEVKKPKKVGFIKDLLHLSLKNLDFSLGGHQVADYLIKKAKYLILVNPRVNLTALMFMGTVCFGNDHVAAIMGFGDLQWGNILITRVYFVEGLGHNLFSVGNDLEVFQSSNIIRNVFVLHTLVEAARTMLIFSLAPLFLWAEAIATACLTQNRSIIHLRFNKTPYELINGKKPDISFLHVFGALCYPKNDREDIGKLGAKGDIEFFIGYSTDSCAYRVYNHRTKKIMETMNVLFDELSVMAFEKRSSKPGLNSMTSGQISSRLNLTYAPSTITTQQPTEGELDLLFEAM
nr:hypothetical protein [Tanacetum cinerariifolium]